MDAINPWLDPSEVRHLADQLLRPVAPARLSAADPGFGASFEGFIKSDEAIIKDSPREEKAADPPESRVSFPAEPAHITREAITSEASADSPSREAYPSATIPETTAPSPPPAPPSHTRFLERIQIFRNWLAKNFSATDIFILDREGKVIFDESGHGRLHFMARNLALASRGSGNIHVKIGPSAILEVIPCETPYGRIVLGTLVPESLPSDHLQTVVEVLKQTASPG